jgi:hypothetical protein
MRYSPSTLQFFWLGRKLFGGRFIYVWPKTWKWHFNRIFNAEYVWKPVWKDIHILKLKDIILINLVSWGR